MIREYRYKLTTAGQSSPPWVADIVIQILREKFGDQIKNGMPISVIDVGCGLGAQMKIINQRLHGLFCRIDGIDWSPATVSKHNSDSDSVYNVVKLCDSKKLPYDNDSFDIALSMENLEHLYGDYSIAAIAELCRIAKCVVITTPLPEKVIDRDWLSREMAEAILDKNPVTRHDYICLESAVHKSTIFPISMFEAGFAVYKAPHGFMIGESSNIVVDRIRAIGIDETELDRHFPLDEQNKDIGLKDRYLGLLAKSFNLHDEICRHPYFREGATL